MRSRNTNQNETENEMKTRITMQSLRGATVEITIEISLRSPSINISVPGTQITGEARFAKSTLIGRIHTGQPFEVELAANDATDLQSILDDASAGTIDARQIITTEIESMDQCDYNSHRGAMNSAMNGGAYTTTNHEAEISNLRNSLAEFDATYPAVIMAIKAQRQEMIRRAENA